MKKILITTLLCALSFTVFADEAKRSAQDGNPPIEKYHYGMKLDVAKLVSQDPAPEGCDVAPVHMTYLDSSAKKHTLEYLVVGDGCTN